MKKVKLYWKKIVVVVVLLVLLGFVAFMYLKLTELTNQLTYLQDSTNVILSDVGNLQSNIEKTLEEDASMIEDAMEEYSAIGDLEIQFTEIDMHNPDDSEDALKEQAERYKEIFQMLTKADQEGRAKVTSVTFWGLDDDVTWLTGFKGETSYPLLFDAEHEKKPCYDSILAVGNGK